MALVLGVRMTDELLERLAAVGVVEPSGSLVDLLGALWLQSVRSNHLWAWPYRTGVVLENVFHVHVVEASGTSSRTLLNVNADWLWFDELVATPVRSITLDTEAALIFLDQVTRAMEERSVRAWTWFGPWWIAFRDAHSELHADAPSGPTPPSHDHNHEHGHDHD